VSGASSVPGLSSVVVEHYQNQFSVIKSNIGHSILASGLASCIKVALSLYHQKIPPTINYQTPNPNIDLKNSPFYVVNKLVDWKSQQSTKGQNQPLRAALNSYGVGGSNAHAILEQYLPQHRTVPVPFNNDPFVIPLSAKYQAGLKNYAQKILHFLDKGTAKSDAITQREELTNMAYTLQMGREAMNFRVAFVINGLSELTTKLQEFINQNKDIEDCFQGESVHSKPELMPENLSDGQSARKLAELWVHGATVEWDQLYYGITPHRMSLPTYPFSLKRYWPKSDHRKTSTSLIPKIPNPSQYSETQLPTDKNIRIFLASFLAQELNFPQDKILFDKKIREYGVDSITNLKMRRSLEQIFTIKISGRELLQHQTLESLSTYLVKKTALNPKVVTQESDGISDDSKKRDIRILEQFQQGLITLEQALTQI